MNDPRLTAVRPRVYSSASPPGVLIELVASPETSEALRHLAGEEHISEAEVIRRAFALYSLSSEMKKQNKRLAIVDREGNMTEIEGL